MTAGAVDVLVAHASTRTEACPGDARSGSVFERLVIDGEGYFLKRLSPESDWVMRITGDRVHRPYLLWRAGILDRVPDCIDHTVVAMQVEGEGDAAVLSILMRDVADDLVPEGSRKIPGAQHRGFLEHLAALSAMFWGWEGIPGLSTMNERLRYCAPENIAAELERTPVPGPIAAAEAGWRALATRAPELLRVARAVHDAPDLVAAPLAGTPPTLLHGDWKMGNLGTRPDGRTILLDWAQPGSGPVCWDLCWYLALNRERLPETKETAMERLCGALERRGTSTSGWWERQLDLCVVGIMATFGWEKALGDETELRWWASRVADAVRRQQLVVPGAVR
jgi:Phosphotransferase enzyme family